MTFTPKALARIHRCTAGIPRLINLMCDRALLAAFSAHANRVVPKHVSDAAANLEMQRPVRETRHWLRQRLSGFTAGLMVAATLAGGAAAAWHYREFGSRLFHARLAAPAQMVADHQ